MTSPVIIRAAQPNDFDAWLPLWNAYNHFYGRSGATALPQTITQTTWNRFHDVEEPMYAYVAELDGDLVGFVHCIFHRTTISPELTCYLQDLFTKGEMRGRGIARKLIEAAYKRAQEEGSARVYWLTHETNLTAMKLYDQVAEKSGFLQYRKSFIS